MRKEEIIKIKRAILSVLAMTLMCSVSTFGEGETHWFGKFKFSFPFGKKYDYDDIRVTRVIDGDTIQLESGERVRLIGIDTPEARYNPKLVSDASIANWRM